jgi:Ala-tRNA(Pro) deacylase
MARLFHNLGNYAIMGPMKPITKKIFDLLAQHSIEYQYIEHDAAVTCEQSAAARGESQDIGGKTILFKGGKDYFLFVISAAKAVDSNKVRKILKKQKLRFATEQELMDLCQVEKGALPPFGEPIYQYPLYIDQSVYENDKIAFNAGDVTKSVIMGIKDYLQLVDAHKVSFAKD